MILLLPKNTIVSFGSCFPPFQKSGKFSQACNFWWVTSNLMHFIYLESLLKSKFCNHINCYQYSLFRVSVTVKPSRSLLAVRYHKLFDMFYEYLVEFLRNISILWICLAGWEFFILTLIWWDLFLVHPYGMSNPNNFLVTFPRYLSMHSDKGACGIFFGLDRGEQKVVHLV